MKEYVFLHIFSIRDPKIWNKYSVAYHIRHFDFQRRSKKHIHAENEKPEDEQPLSSLPYLHLHTKIIGHLLHQKHWLNSFFLFKI